MVRTSGENLDSWIDEMTRLLARFIAQFEEVYGYPPGDNYVSRSYDSHAGSNLAKALEGTAATDLMAFYSRVDRVSLPDVDVGFFVNDATHVAEDIRDPGPMLVKSSLERTVVMFGSDGGGALFAIDTFTGEVVRLRGGAVVGSIYEVEEIGVYLVARDFDGFLQFLLGQIIRQLG